jgi:hypothetical protein
MSDWIKRYFQLWKMHRRLRRLRQEYSFYFVRGWTIAEKSCAEKIALLEAAIEALKT